MKKLLRVTLLSICTAFVIAPAHAATYNIVFDDPTIAGAANWFGTFEAPTGDGYITSFLATINGVTYDTLNFWPPTVGLLSGELSNWVTDAPYGSGVVQSLLLSSSQYYLGSCDSGCNVGEVAGTFVISAAPSAVPIPAALPLFAAGLSAMGFMGWRRKRRTVG